MRKILRLGGRDQFIGKDKLGARDGVERQVQRLGTHQQQNFVAFQPQELAVKPFALGNRAQQIDLRFETGEAFKVAPPRQRPVDPGRGNLELVGGFDRVGDIEQGRDRMADGLAILDRHAGIVDPFGHDLQRRPGATAAEGDAHAVAHRGQGDGPIMLGFCSHRTNRDVLLSNDEKTERRKSVQNKKWASRPTGKTT